MNIRSSSMAMLAGFAFIASSVDAEENLPKVEAGLVGRYQLVVSHADRMFLVDTTTGQCWSRIPGTAWQDEGRPTSPSERAAKVRVPPPAPKLNLPPVLKLAAKSIEMTISQRDTVPVPGSEETVLVRLGDITGGQVVASIVTMDDKLLLEKMSFAPGDDHKFQVGKTNYTIKLDRLRNALIGDDTATFTIAEGEADKAIRLPKP